MYTGNGKNGKNCLVISARQLSAAGNNGHANAALQEHNDNRQALIEEITKANTKLKRQRRQLAALLRTI